MDNIIKKFKITSGSKFKIKNHPTDDSGDYIKDEAELVLERLKTRINKLQDALYAEHRHTLLIIFQAMDAAGKDSAIEHTMSGLNPQGCQVYSFKQPSKEELDHDFLWRHYRALPETGRIGIHNRSHYEDVLVCKVHPETVLAQHLPGIEEVKDIDDVFWKRRYNSIRCFEEHLSDNGTVIIKFFLNVSKEEQKERFLARIDDPEKNWKFSESDIAERDRWKDYMHAYEDAINATATDKAPWYVIPADKKWFTRIAISTIMLQVLEDMNLKYPVLPDEEMAKLAKVKNGLLKK
ncbi:polyphosphate kinase 2 family protein [Mucilaginibacter sp. HMF5004]|uniref:polyphosphate kinase 2 family protein n=1 Tax=Mucilaginibacter rivuli TaxID=2857527 RepID=UPI001C5F9E08|nr:polyphosphate kinase 2 family protein [Mucilaginibacter rivuli]MBW4889520.1 polyphosphate kinase 2 family protein [Mucilaginibacter rivuli]